MIQKREKTSFSHIFVIFHNMYMDQKSNYIDMLHAENMKENALKNMSKIENRAIFKKF